jgi:hypothetical protein
MTAHHDFKIIIRARMAKTGESYTTSRVHVMRAQREMLRLPPEAKAAPLPPCDSLHTDPFRNAAPSRRGQRRARPARTALPHAPSATTTLRTGSAQSVRSGPASFGDVFEMRITLLDIEPAIWRRVRVPASASLAALHEVLQIAFGWKNSHLHDFLINDIRFSMADVEDELFSVDERAAPLGAVARAGGRLIYLYDFGDDWEHEVTVERVMAEGDESFVCVDGARACPPEDCGGASGYARLLEVLANPNDEEHAEMRKWVGRGFDPEKFDVTAVNKKLASLSKRLGQRRK